MALAAPSSLSRSQFSKLCINSQSPNSPLIQDQMTSYYTTFSDKCPKPHSFSHSKFCNFGWNECDNWLTCLLGPLFFFTALIILFLTVYRIGTACHGTITFNLLSSVIAGLLATQLLPAIIAVAKTYRPLVALLFSIPDFVVRNPDGEEDKVSLAAFRSLNAGWASQVNYLYAGFGILIFTLAYAGFYFCAAA